MTRAHITAVLFALVLALGCNEVELVEDPPKVVDYSPWRWGAHQETPECRNPDQETVSEDGREITCLWRCALYWTPGRVGLHYVEKCWTLGDDGFWREVGDADGCGVAVCLEGE